MSATDLLYMYVQFIILLICLFVRLFIIFPQTTWGFTQDSY